MTQKTYDQDAKQDSGFPAGIYLEEKKSSIGTGGTAQVAQYRNFWVTMQFFENAVEMLLLNDDFYPTPIREIFPLETIKGPGWHFIAEGEKRYNKLRPYLDRMLSSGAGATKEEAPAKTAGGNWWEANGGSGTKSAAKKKPAAANTKNNWWSK